MNPAYNILNVNDQPNFIVYVKINDSISILKVLLCNLLILLVCWKLQMSTSSLHKHFFLYFTDLLVTMSEKSATSNPLEQFVLLAKTAKGAAAIELVKQALEAPGVYVFGELLDMPNIQEVR